MELQRIEGLVARIAEKVCAEKLHPAYKRLNKLHVQAEDLEKALNDLRNDNRDQKKLAKDLQDVIEALRQVKGKIGSIEDDLVRG